ncbi:ROK family glucokinase [Tepidibacillus fermentans]|uniref:Glucokinase n=1 Tax=Tepidibacillus fermentans TaxID=1281767 RepID=A0A4R3KFK5_9BACI|nr:ROK family glucokinase [Tepidibacillus fermentans]TCS81779.1 glucokinase [Tepidibacillus fermentans]
MEKKEIYIGIDLGGTTIKMGLISDKGELLEQLEIPTRTKEGYQTIIEDIVQHSKKLVSETGFEWENVKGMGIGIPGLLDIESGIVRMAPNLHWTDIPIKQILEEKLQILVQIENDGNIAALGETWMGAGKGYKHVVMATIGTGIGAGIIVNGQILHGKSGMAAELGHIPISDKGIVCGCGNVGCLETVSSATGIIRMAQEVVKNRKNSLLTERFEGKLDQITAKSVFDAAKEKDKEAVAIVEEAAHLLGKALATVANLFDPEIIIIGGGVSKAGVILFDPIREAFYQYGLKNIVKNVQVVPATLGNTAGMIGAAALFHV